MECFQSAASIQGVKIKKKNKRRKLRTLGETPISERDVQILMGEKRQMPAKNGLIPISKQDVLIFFKNKEKS